MAQPPIAGFQVDESTFENILESGTSFPGAPATGKQFFLTTDIVGGSPSFVTYIGGEYIFDGTNWISKPKSTTGTNWGWNDYLASASNIDVGAPGTSPDLVTIRDNIRGWGFDPTSLEQAWSSVHILHDYVIGTNLYPHIHWTHDNAAPTGFVRWGLEFTIAKGYNQEAFPASTTIYFEQAADAQYIHHLIEAGLGTGSPTINNIIDGTNVEPDTIIMFRIFRDSTNDTFGSDAILMYVDFHYQSDGSFTTERNQPFPKVP